MTFTKELWIIFSNALFLKPAPCPLVVPVSLCMTPFTFYKTRELFCIILWYESLSCPCPLPFYLLLTATVRVLLWQKARFEKQTIIIDTSTWYQSRKNSRMKMEDKSSSASPLLSSTSTLEILWLLYPGYDIMWLWSKTKTMMVISLQNINLQYL